MSSAASPTLSDAARRAARTDRILGLSIVAVAFVLSLALSLWAKTASRPETSAPPGPPRTDGITGYPSAVSPTQIIPVVRTLTRRTLLRGFVAEGVRSDGTVDLSEGPGQVRFSFQSPAGQGPQPPREPGSLPRRDYCGKQNVHLRKEGLVADPDLAEYPCPPAHADPLPDPRCDLRQVWAHALTKGAARERLARIEYYRSNAGPAWRFELPGSTQ
ncbi:MAG TPA: hypothetical protein VK524_16215, partial [Polyangiaceae bacterium]|nr:hypothetical protein [Polyangiaceae bacterium]